MDETSVFGLPSTKTALFMDGRYDFVLSSTFLAFFMDRGCTLKISTLRKYGIKIGKIVDEAVNKVTRRWLQGEDSNLK